MSYVFLGNMFYISLRNMSCTFLGNMSYIFLGNMSHVFQETCLILFLGNMSLHKVSAGASAAVSDTNNNIKEGMCFELCKLLIEKIIQTCHFKRMQKRI